MTELPVLTVAEVAVRWRVSERAVAAMVRDGRLPRLPVKPTRIPLVAVLALEAYSVRDGEPNGQASSQATPSRRRNRLQANGSLEAAPVGGGSAVHGRIGPKAGDVVIRRVEI